MNLSELAPSWRKQNDSQGRLNANALAGVIRRAELARWTNLLMGIVGFVIALLVVWDFGRMMMNAPRRLVQAGAAVVVVAALALLPLIIRDLWPIRSTGESTCNYFSQELRRTEKLIASNKSPVFYVLLALLNIGLVLMVMAEVSTTRAILVIVGLSAIDIVGLWGARIIVRRAELRRVDLEALLAEFREGKVWAGKVWGQLQS